MKPYIYHRPIMIEHKLSLESNKERKFTEKFLEI